ncbi:MAG: polysaccharide deacetylase family protein [Acidobacteriota bacterium]|jgi:peptidoglycan/xylan/chitin deacetylase (PgdA/CDA1 family)
MHQNTLCPLILGLHRIGYPPKGAAIRGLFTSPKLLRFELAFLKSLGYRFSTLTEAFLFPQPKTAVITFDDGYRDNLIAAESILSEFQAPATVFVITSDIGKKSVVWEEAGEKLPAAMLSWDELKKLKALGWEIGSHSHQHVHHNRLNEKQQRLLIADSIEAIAKNIGERPKTFAYPYGAYDLTTKRIIRELGIHYAVTTRPPAGALQEINNLDKLELPRIAFGGRHLLHYLRAINKTRAAIKPGNTIFSSFSVGTRAIFPNFGKSPFPARDEIVP